MPAQADYNELVKWEYRAEFMDTSAFGITIAAQLNEYGAFGWEAIGIVSSQGFPIIQVYFKRPLSGPQADCTCDMPCETCTGRIGEGGE